MIHHSKNVTIKKCEFYFSEVMDYCTKLCIFQ